MLKYNARNYNVSLFRCFATFLCRVVHVVYAYEMEPLKIKRCTDADEAFHIKKLTFYMEFHRILWLLWIRNGWKSEMEIWDNAFENYFENLNGATDNDGATYKSIHVQFIKL